MSTPHGPAGTFGDEDELVLPGSGDRDKPPVSRRLGHAEQLLVVDTGVGR
jgi:hypothetical protein